MKTMENCIFCKIIKKEIPATIISESENSISFLDINPVRKGHALVIPKDHHPWIDETPDETLSFVMIEAKKIIKAIKKGLGADFVSVSVIGTDVPHFHVHLIPRMINDDLRGWPTQKYGEEESKIVSEKIRENL